MNVNSKVCPRPDTQISHSSYHILIKKMHFTQKCLNILCSSSDLDKEGSTKEIIKKHVLSGFPATCDGDFEWTVGKL